MGDASEQEMQVALRVFAHYLGVNADTEPDLLAVAEEVFYDLPLNWEVGIGEDEHAGIPYFYNTVTGESDWKHPKEEMCFRKVKQARRDIEINKKKDQDRERDQELQRNTNSRFNQREKAEVTEVEMIEDVVEDFEDGTPPRNATKANNVSNGTQLGPAQVKTQEVRGRSSVASRNEGFGMSDADFLDADEPTAPRHNNTRNGPDNSMSPPLFKEMRAGEDYDSETSPQRASLTQGSDRDRDRFASQSLVHGNTAHTTGVPGGKDSTAGSGWAASTTGIASAALGTQSQANRRMDDREPDRDTRDLRDRERDNSNLRGRNVNTGDEYRGNNANSREGANSNNGRGRELSREGNNNFNRNRDRDASSRDGRDPRAETNNNNAGREKGAWNRLEEEGQRFNRDSRDTRDNRENNRDSRDTRDTSRGRGDTRDQDWRRDNRSASSTAQTNVHTQNARPTSTGSAATHTVHNADHVTERERELKVELQKYQDDVRKLADDNSELTDKLVLSRTKHTAELSTYKEDVARLELRLNEERRERKVLEEQVTHAHAEHHSKVRDLEDVHEIKLREAVRKARAETEDEGKEKIRTLERRAVEEQDALRAELALSKRKLDETLREVDAHKRKVTLSKADGKAEAQMEIDTLRATLREAEENERKQSTELRRLREELASVQGRLVGAMQAVQLANAESDALRATAHTAVHDEQAQSGAVQAAVQRIQQLDIEVAQYKAENVLLRREKDTLTQELRKAKGTAEFSGDRLSSTESETRRIKSQALAENGRLQSRVAELEALSSVLRGQLDQASAQQAQAVREVTRQLDTVENEAARLKDRLVDREVKEDALHTRIKASEREVIRLQEVIFKKDRQLREESEKTESIQAQIDSIRQSCEQETIEVRKELTRQKQLNSELALQHKEECEKLENEVSRKVPELIQQAVHKVESSLTTRHHKELADLTLMLDHRYDKLRIEMSDLQAIYSEKEARMRLNTADEKMELEKLRNNNKVHLRKIEELEEVIQELKRQLRLSGHTSAYPTPHNNSQMYASGGYSTQRKPRPFPNTPFGPHNNPYSTNNNHNNMNNNGYDHLGKARTSLDFSTMLEASFDGVRQSMQGHTNTPSLPPPSYDGRFDNAENYPPGPPTSMSHPYYHHQPQQHYQQQGYPHEAHHQQNQQQQYDAHPNNNQLYPEDEPLTSMAVSFLNDQLADMKRQISRSLGEKSNKNHHDRAMNNGSDARDQPDFAMQRADEAVREINSSVLGLTGAAGSNSNNSAVHGSGRGGTPGAHNHVKFSADALFHSPQHPSVGGGSSSAAGGGSNTGSRHRRHGAVAGDMSALLLQDEELMAARTSTSGNNRNAERASEQEIETLDEPSYHNNNKLSQDAAAASAPDQVSHNHNANASMMSDFSLNNISMVSDHPGINTSAYGHSHTPYTNNNFSTQNPYNRPTNSTPSMYGSYSTTHNNNNYANISTSSVHEFSHISDGGYHEGYWRTKYSRAAKQ